MKFKLESTFLADDVTRHSTMRHDEEEFVFFAGNRDTEKTKIVDMLTRSRGNGILFSDILANADGGVVTR